MPVSRPSYYVLRATVPKRCLPPGPVCKLLLAHPQTCSLATARRNLSTLRAPDLLNSFFSQRHPYDMVPIQGVALHLADERLMISARTGCMRIID